MVSSFFSDNRVVLAIFVPALQKVRFNVYSGQFSDIRRHNDTIKERTQDS